MTNEEDTKAAEEHILSLVDPPDTQSEKNAFLAGIAHARRWHRYPEEKPKVSGEYLVYFNRKFFPCSVLRYSVEMGGWNISDSNRKNEIFGIVAWQPIYLPEE